jgi:hypothetical protein
MRHHSPCGRVSAVLWVLLALLHSLAVLAQAPTVLVTTNSAWRSFKGLAEPSPANLPAWRTIGFQDVSWAESKAPFWYGEDALFGGTGTQLTDMQNRYSSVFLRQRFTVTNPGSLESLELSARCDDGFIAWINGIQVAAFNPPTGTPTFNSLASANAPEPALLIDYPLPAALSTLVPGENVLAVQVFNTSLGSSDIVFDGMLTATPRPSAFPIITSVQPAPGRLTALDRITVVFSEPVRGVTADDFLINGTSARRVEGTGANYTFFFDPPSFGPVEIRWGTLHAIEDFETPPRRFEITADGSVWGYELIDPLGPSVAFRQPPAGITVSALSEVLINFDKAVTGVDAADLLRDGIPATRVTGFGAGPYRFEFPPASTGRRALSFTANHGIASDTSEPHPFAGASWAYTVDAQAIPAALRITEFMAENFTTQRDEDLDPEDWIEIFNPTATAVNLEGWSLSNEADEPDMWVFPAISLPPNAYLVVFASAKDRRPTNPTLRLHTNFKLNPNGGYLGLFAPELPRRAVSEITFPEQGPNHSYGRENNTGDWRYYLNGTPGTRNGTSPIRTAVADVVFSVPRGFFTGALDLTLSCPTPNAVIRFTTNGSPPTLVDGFRYTNAIPLNVSRVIRAAAFLTNALPSRIGTHTYLVNQANTRLRVPAISLVTATNNLYGRNGIMEVNPRNTTKRGAAWERPVSVEWIRPDGEAGFQADCGLRVQGGDYVRGQYNYRTTDIPFSKYSFRLYFRGEYGQGRLNYPLFPETTQTSFDTVVLRAGMNDATNPYLTDEFVRSLVRDTGQPSPAGTFVHLFLNGAYRGYYNPCERIDIDFLRAYHGGGDQWDVMAQVGEVREGDATAFNTLRTLASSRDLTQPANYRDVASRLDLTNFVDYLLPLIYVDNDDWPHNNWRAARERVPGGKYRMYCWDAEWAFGFVNGHPPTWDTIRNQLSSTSPPWGGADIQRIFIGLRKAPEFRQFFADRAHRHFFNGGVLTDDRIRSRYATITNRLAGIVSGFNNRIATTWIPQRRRNVLLHLERAGLLASSNAPAFHQFGGRVPDGFRLTMTNITGAMFYTTNGSDPRISFSGEISPEAKPYSGPVPVPHSLLLRARTLVGTNWSAVTEAAFEVNRIGIPLVISEIMYNPPGGEAFEFIELHNHGTLPLDLSGHSFTGIEFRFPTPSPLMPPGARWILANAARPSDFAARYPEVTVAGWFDASLNNGGERIELLAPNGTLVTAVEYEDDPPWPTQADGSGASLEFTRASEDPHDPAAWQASQNNGGSPARAPSPQPLPAVRLSEITAALAPAPDWIELHNAGNTAAALDGWSLSDDDNPTRFVFPAGTSIAPGGWIRIWCGTNSNDSLPGLRTTFGLSRRGETIALYDANRLRVDAVTFGHLPDGFSLGRLGSSLDWQLTEPSPLAPNEAAPLASPSLLALNEWMANPIAGEADWVEFHNRSSTAPIALRGLFLATSNSLTQIRSHSFVGPSEFVVLFANEDPGPDQLALKLPANAGAIILSAADGSELNRVDYRLPLAGHPLNAEGISLGRLPNGTGTIVAFPGTTSPGAANYLTPPAGPRFNEFMAANASAVAHPSGRFVDWIELHHSGTTAFSLAGIRIAIGDASAETWTFPPGASIPAQGHLVVWCDPTSPATVQNSAPFNLGRGLPAEGSTLWLINPQGQVLDSVPYGAQLPDRSVGRSALNTWALLVSPTLNAPNAANAPLGTATSARINEWIAGTRSQGDWVELHNPDPLPIDLGSHYLTDDPSVAGILRFQIAPLTFIPGRGHLTWLADQQPDQGHDHLPFQLDPTGETLRLYTPNRLLIDSLSYDAQPASVARGRFPDGTSSIVVLPGSASPGEANWRAHPSVVVAEVLTHTDPPLEDAIELHNPTAHAVSLDGWRVSNSSRDLDKFRIPPGTVLLPNGRLVLYEKDFNPSGSAKAFTLNSAHGDDVWISEVNATGDLTGFRAHASFGAAANGISFGLHRTSIGWDFPPLSRLTFGRDLPTSLAEFRQGSGLPNAYPLVGPVVVSEILFNPTQAGTSNTVALPDDEFVELHNNSSRPVPLFDPSFPGNTWRLRGGVDFDFPPGITLAPFEHALVVRFDPVSAAATEFRTRRSLPVTTRLVGPFTGRLSDTGEELRLERPDRPQTAPAPDAGFVPFLLVERIDYLPGFPWPQPPVTTESSLQRRRVAEYANDPANWISGPPSPGAATPPPITDLDFDGMPNDWETRYGLNPNQPTDADLDADGDGLSNLAEHLAGTHPRDPASALTLQLAIEASAGAVVRFNAVANRSYSVLRREDAAFGPWEKVADVPAESSDRPAAVSIGVPTNAASFLKVITPATPSP